MVTMTNLRSPNLMTPERFPDRDLLRRFIHDGDEQAFARIVERHAALVMSVCRRVVGQSADVDDAFQATFFALSRRPHSIYECRSLSGWLYSVAWRTSVRLVRLRNRTTMQSLPELTPSAEADPLDLITEAGNLAALDEELNQLPEKYRNVLVMSYFAEQTNQEIADQLNESKGAVDGRIRDARRLLRVRLARRGVEVGVLAIAAGMTQAAAATVPPALIQTTIRFGSLNPALSTNEMIPGVDLARLKLLTLTGTSLMTTRTGFATVAGMLFLSGVFGMARLTATQEGSGAGDGLSQGTLLNPDAAAGGVEVLPLAVPAIVRGVPFESELATTPATVADVQPATKSMTAVGKKTGAAVEFASPSARKAERQIHEMMRTERISAISFPGDTSLDEVLKVLADSLSNSRGEPLLILLDETDPDIGENPHFLEETTVSNVHLPEGSMTIASALELIFAKVKDQELTWIVKDEVLLITTVATAESEENLILRSYDITHLRGIKFPSERTVAGGSGGGHFGGAGVEGGGMGGGGGFFSLRDTDSVKSSEQPAAGVQQPPGMSPNVATQVRRPVSWEDGLVLVIQEMTSPPCLWIQNGDDIGSMSLAGNRLLVYQTRRGHEKVVQVLDELGIAAEEIGEAEAP
jgi:RNA polymerase sigma factor (sigma-70 family)